MCARVVARERGVIVTTVVTTQRFRSAETGRTVEAVQVDDSPEGNVADLIEWIGAERAHKPGFVIAFKGWTGTWWLCKHGDWIVYDEQFSGHFRHVESNTFEQAYEVA